MVIIQGINLDVAQAGEPWRHPRRQTSATKRVYRTGIELEPRGSLVFQIVRCILADNGEVTLREPLQPLFELWEDATAMAEFDSSRLSDDYGYDEARECWWGSDSRGRMYRFEVEQVAAAEAAA